MIIFDKISFSNRNIISDGTNAETEFYNFQFKVANNV